MNEITTVGLDLAKNVFHVVALDAREREVLRKKLRRGQVLGLFAQLPRCVVGMEACGGAHYWARELERLGQEVKLVAAQHVKAFVRGNKHDYNDARAIAEAVCRPGIRAVAVKTQAQQDIQALHRLRQGCVKQRTALANRVRGLVAEYGVVWPQGIHVVRRRLAELLEDADHGLSETLRAALAQAYEQLCELDRHVTCYGAQIERLAKANDTCRRLQTIPGIGPLTASMLYASFAQGEQFRRGRELAAALGIVPAQHSTGGKPRLLGISKRGDPYRRSLLVHGARSVVTRATRQDDSLSRWINGVRARRGFNKAVVALANKLARIAWAVLHQHTVYRPA